MSTFPPRFPSRLRGVRGVEEEFVEAVVVGALRLSSKLPDFLLLIGWVINDVFACTGPRAGDDEPANDARWCIQCDELRDAAAHTESQQVDFLNFYCSEEVDDMLCHVCHGGSHVAAALSDTCIVEEYHRTGGSAIVDEDWIPEIHRAPEMDQEQERYARCFSKPSVGILYIAVGDILCLGCLMGRFHISSIVNQECLRHIL